MQIVIDVPDQIYEMVINTGTYGYYRFNSTKAIRDGVPLPKRHGRLIDADDIDNHIIGHVDTRGCPTIIEADEVNEEME